jgi:hypothetical protein
MRGMWTKEFSNSRDHFRRNAQTVGSLVPGNLVGNQSEERSQCFGAAAYSGTW